jgi:hypothetical protein
MTTARTLLVVVLGLAAGALAATRDDTTLFNGKDLTGWDTVLRGANPGDPDYGLNRDPEHVFGVATLDGGPVISISGKYWGGLITTREYGNYHLRLEFKWGTKRWPPRATVVRDSGLLYHCAAPASMSAWPWPRSIEFNITEHDTGEFYSVEGAIADAEVVPVGDSPEERAAFQGWCERNDEHGPRLRFRKGGERHAFDDGSFMPGGDFEGPVGAWNVLDLYAVGDRSVHVVNGKVAVVLTGLRQKVDGKEVPLTKGRIELQTESAEIFFRKLELERIEAIPGELLN